MTKVMHPPYRFRAALALRIMRFPSVDIVGIVGILLNDDDSISSSEELVMLKSENGIIQLVSICIGLNKYCSNRIEKRKVVKNKKCFEVIHSADANVYVQQQEYELNRELF